MRRGKLYVLCGLQESLTEVGAWLQRWLLAIGCSPDNFGVLQLQQVPTEKETYDMQASIPEGMTVIALLPSKIEWHTRVQISEACGHLAEAADAIAGIVAMPVPKRYSLQVVKDRTGLMPNMLAVRT